jgi:hypothetical protein
MINLQRNPQSTKRTLKTTISPLSSLTISQQLSIECHSPFNLLSCPMQMLTFLQRSSNTTLDLVCAPWKCCVGYEIKACRGFCPKLLIDRLCNAAIMPTPRCIEVGCNDSTYNGFVRSPQCPMHKLEILDLWGRTPKLSSQNVHEAIHYRLRSQYHYHLNPERGGSSHQCLQMHHQEADGRQ